MTMAEWSNTERHILFSTPSVGVNVFHVCLNVLLVLDLGICQHICASSLYLMVFDSALPGTLEEKLGVVWGQMCTAYDAECLPPVGLLCQRSTSSCTPKLLLAGTACLPWTA